MPLPFKAPPTRNKVRMLDQVDFSGGLNLESEQFRLFDNESPDLLNVDINFRGGIQMRNVVAPLHSTNLASDPLSMWAYEAPSVGQYIVHCGSTAYWSTGGNFTSLGHAAATLTGPMRAVTFKDLNYIQRNAEAVPFKWDGTTATSLTASSPTFQDDITAPTGGYMPKATCIAVHTGYVWVANTVENGTTYRNRIRWSHPNRPEDWRTNDYIDIDVGHDGDSIVALVPWQASLLVFKRKSCHVITGFSPESFNVSTLDPSKGTEHQDSVVATKDGVYFWSWPGGVYRYEGGGMTSLFGQLAPAVIGGDIPPTYRAKIMLGYGRSRLWVSVPWGSATTRSRTYVFDPSLALARRAHGILRYGSWVRYDLAVGPFLEWAFPGATSVFLAAGVGKSRILKLEQTGAVDNFGGSDTHVSSHYRTHWLDLGAPAMKKRWKRPQFVMHGDTAAALTVLVYKDYNSADFIRSFTVTAATVDSMEWDTDTWDGAQWGTSGTNTQIIRGSPMGTHKALSLYIEGPTANKVWGIDALTLKYVPRPVRS